MEGKGGREGGRQRVAGKGGERERVTGKDRGWRREGKREERKKVKLKC